jgi:glycine betaine transporter
MLKNPLLLIALTLTIGVSIWGTIDTEGLSQFAAKHVGIVLQSRGWFVMLAVSILLITSLFLAFSKYGRIKLGRDDDQPEFSTMSWMTMMFAAGMGVGLLFYGAAEPITHYLFGVEEGLKSTEAARVALFITNFNWGLHAWAIYGMMALVIAYFGFRKNTPQLISAPVSNIFGDHPISRGTGWLTDLLSIYAIAIGLSGSLALGVFQVQDGVSALFNLETTGMGLRLIIFGILCVAYILPLTVDLSKGMAVLSNTAIIIAVAMMVYLLILGPTSFLMDGIVESIGGYFSKVIPHGFMTYTFFNEEVKNWYQSWSLNYMVWWLAWSPFVGVFIARISRGRTIRQFILGVLFAPTFFSIFWFGVFGGLGFYQGSMKQLDPAVIQENINQTTFLLLENMPLPFLTTVATSIAAFLFIVTSVVSAAYVLAMFSTGGLQDPPVKIKLIWGGILGALVLAMILSDSVSAIRQIIAMSAGPFVFIVLLLLVCFLKSLKKERL